VVAGRQAKHYAETVSTLRSCFSLLLGAAKTAESLGAAFSNLLGQAVAGHVSYRCAIGGLASTGLIPLALCLGSFQQYDAGGGKGLVSAQRTRERERERVEVSV